MKKITLCTLFISTTMLYTSCYNVSTCVNMNGEDPAVLVNTVHNSHYIYGLVGHPNVNASKYTSGEKYKVRTYQSFIDALISAITFGIYTPSTTEFYEPIR